MENQYDYIIDNNRLIGQGSFGKVYACKRINKSNNQVEDICVKVKIFPIVKIIAIKAKLDLNHKTFLREKDISNLLSKLKNPNIVEIYDVQTEQLKDDIILKIFMEMCDDQDLQQEIQIKRQFTIGETIHTLSQIISGYHTLYEKKILHRDLKPKNILKLKNGVLKITDFGLSRFIQKQPDETMFLTAVGSPFYVSPQILLQLPYTNKTDVFSLGIIFYQLLHQGAYPINPQMLAEFVERYKQLERNRIQIKLNNNDPKKDEIERLLNSMLVFNENDRISWPELFEHPFFKTYIHKTLQLGQVMPKQKKGIGQNQQSLQEYYQQQKLNIEDKYQSLFKYLQTLLQFYFQAINLLEKIRDHNLKSLLIKISNDDYYDLITSLVGCKYCALATCFSLFNQSLVNLSEYDQQICRKLGSQNIKSFPKLKDINVLNEKIFNEFKQEVEIEFNTIQKTTKTTNATLQMLLQSSKYEYFQYLKIVQEILLKYVKLEPKRESLHKVLVNLQQNLSGFLLKKNK